MSCGDGVCHPRGPPAMPSGIKQAGTSPSVSTSVLGGGGEQPCSDGDRSFSTAVGMQGVPAVSPELVLEAGAASARLCRGAAGYGAGR